MKKPEYNHKFYYKRYESLPPKFNLFPEYRQWFLNKDIPTKSDKQDKFLRKIIWQGLSSISKKKYKQDVDYILSIIDLMGLRDWFEYCTYQTKGRSGKTVTKIYKGEDLIKQIEKFMFAECDF